MKIEELFRQQHKIEQQKIKQHKLKMLFSYVADKWIDFLALIIATIALIRTF